MQKPKSRKKARVTGLVSYLNDKKQRVAIPKEDCVLVEESITGPFTLIWMEGKEKKSTSLTLKEYAYYLGRKTLKIEGEP